ncbi:MAG: toprim domain-containing protein [Pseudomonadota bacterium]
MDHYGDLLDLIRINRGLETIAEAMREAEAFLGEAAEGWRTHEPLRRGVVDISDNKKRDAAERLVSRSGPIAGTQAAAYLGTRGLSTPGDADLLFHPNAFYRDGDEKMRSGPALIAPIRSCNGTLLSVHRTWFDSGLVLIRKMMGFPEDGYVNLGGEGPDVLVGEGIETLLSLAPALNGVRTHALLTATRLAAYEPTDDVKRLFIAVDRDAAGFAAARRAYKTASSRGVQVKFLIPLCCFRGADFNDDLKRLGAGRLAANLKRKTGSPN